MASSAVETHLAAERAAPGATVQSGNHREGLGAARERRKPEFRGS